MPRQATSVPAELRAVHLELIAENPFQCTITLTHKQREGGGFRNVEAALEPMTCRLVQAATGRQSNEEQTSVAGIRAEDPRWELLLPSEPAAATIKPDPEHIYTFEHDTHGRFTITDIKPREDLGEIWGWAASAVRTK